MNNQFLSVFYFLLTYLILFTNCLESIAGNKSSSLTIPSGSCEKLLPDESFLYHMLRQTNIGELEIRLALVIGNSEYESEILGELQNPANDANAVAKILQSLGFYVIKGINLKKNELLKCLQNQFYAKLNEADTALFYYAGHGLQANDRNYIAAIDTNVLNSNATGLIKVEEIIENMRDRQGPSLIYLDACRTSGFTFEKLKSINGENISKIGIGLSPSSFLADKEKPGGEVFLGFATSPNNIAKDGFDENSEFTSAFLRHVGSSGYTVSRVMAAITKDVSKETNYEQTPWMRSSLTEEFYFNGKMTIDDLIANSKNNAEQSRSNLIKGQRLLAIATALKGLPSNFKKNMIESFSEAYSALFTAFHSRPITLAFDDATIVAKIDSEGKYFVAAPAMINLPNRQISIWDLLSKQKIAVVGRGDKDGAITSWDLSSSGGKIASLSKNGVIETWEASNGKKIFSWKGYSKTGFPSIKFNTDNTKIVTTSSTDPVRIWNVETGKMISEFSNDSISSKTKPIKYLYRLPQFTPFGNQVAAIEMKKHQLLIWDIETRKIQTILNGHTGYISGYAFSTNADNRVVTGSNDGTARLWNLHTGKLIHVWPHTAWIHLVAISPDGQRVVTRTITGIIRYWNSESGEEIKDLPVQQRIAFDSLFSTSGEILGMIDQPNGFLVWRKDISGKKLINVAMDELDKDLIKIVKNEQLRYWRLPSK